MNLNKLLFLIPTAVGCVSTALADVKLPALFSDNMVIQQGIVAPIWGKADPGETVKVTVAGQAVTTKAGEDGKWKVKLQPLRSQKEPITVKVEGKNIITLQNVLVGEVWVGSGQSNMQFSMNGVRDSAKEIAAATLPSIRFFTVKPVGWPQPLEDVAGQWVECSPQTAGKFSATLFFFGRDLHQHINQPVGLINSSEGGTVVQSWTRWEVLMTDPECKRNSEARIKQLDDPAWVEQNFIQETAKRIKMAEEKSALEGKPVKPMRADWLGPAYVNRPAGLFNAMVHPLLGFPIRGVVWYQAEFNNGQHEIYARMFPKMIQDWREQWGQGDFPFLFVQLPGNEVPQTEPWDAGKRGKKWAELREAQAKGLTLPNTGMAVTIDTAPDGDLHPKNKQPVGDRLARLAAKLVYGKDVACFSPTFESSTTTGNAVKIKFKHAEGGLVTLDKGPVHGFAIAGADQKFVWADARIEGDSVVVSSPQVATPASVRYAWADNPVISLFNQAGLPAAPFRTDTW